MVQLTATHTTTQTKMFVSSRVLYFVRAAGNLSLFFCVSFYTFSSQLKTHHHFAFCALRFPNPFALTPETRVVPRRRPPPTTNIIMSFFGIGQSKLLSVDVTFATPTRTCVVKSSYTDANHVARETLPLITSGTPICDVCEEEDERLEGKRCGDDYSLAVLFFVFLLLSTTTLMTLSLLTKLLCALKGDSIEGVLHVSPGTPKTRRSKAIYLCRRLGVPLLWSL